MSLKKPTLPEGWINCPRKSSLIADKFIVCKTFLDEGHDNKVPEEYRFNWKSLSSEVKSDHNRSIGMVVDLTNTDRFYNKSSVEEDGCQYVKIACKGYEQCPTLKSVNEFIHTVLNFQFESPESLVCVHCTHGFNRSGFMIISYLCEVMRYDLQASVNIFASARSPGIYKEEYLTELSNRLGNGNEEFKISGKPGWNNGSSFEVSQQPETNFKIKDTKFMDGMIPHVDNINDLHLIQEIQTKVMDMCGWRDCRFPGSQPVSMDSENISKLTLKSYRVSWKADGQRYMMLINGRGEVYMLDRDFAVYKVNDAMFPRRNSIEEHIADTLLDGEMVIDKYPGGKRGRYLIYDIIIFEGQEVSRTPFRNRYECIEFEVIVPRNMACQNNLLNKMQEPFSVSRKDFWDLTKTRKILDGDFLTKLLHDSDGLIFQPLDDAYKFGQCNEIMKWKPPELNTIDFKLVIEKQANGDYVGQLIVTGLKPSFAIIELTERLMKYNNKIIECSWDFEKKVWKFMRERTDKSFPNKLETAQSIMRNIKNPLTKDTLYHVIDKQRFDLYEQSNENTKTMNIIQKEKRIYKKNARPAPSSNDPNISGLTFVRLSNSDPFGLRKEVATLLAKFKSSPHHDKTKVITSSIKRQVDPLGLMDDMEIASPT